MGTVSLWPTLLALIGNFSHKTLFTLCRTVSVLRLLEPRARISVFHSLALGKRFWIFETIGRTLSSELCQASFQTLGPDLVEQRQEKKMFVSAGVALSFH